VKLKRCPGAVELAAVRYLYGQAGETRAGFVSGAKDTPTSFSTLRLAHSISRMTQPIYRGGRTEAQTRQGHQYGQAARRSDTGGRTTVFQAVAPNYLDVVRDQTLSRSTASNEAVLKKQLERRRIASWVEVTRTDVAQAEFVPCPGDSDADCLEGTLEVSPRQLCPPVGHPPGRLILPRERPALPATREEAWRWRRATTRTSFGEFHRMAARDNIYVVRGQLLPQISIVGDLNRTYSHP